MKEFVILVNQQDKKIGSQEKLAAHKKGLLHRAFSVFIFNSSNQLLLQKRAADKYHSGCLWSNSCCGHPRPGEKINTAATRRLMEEMGFACPLKHHGFFYYKTAIKNSPLIEHEIDHLFFGFFDGKPSPNKTEVSEYKWISIADIQKKLQQSPELFTDWFEKALKQIINT